MKKRVVFVSIIILQLIFLTGMIFFHVSRINAATRILLETRPVDPFSVFRGRYINLNYKISTISTGLFKDCNPSDLKSNDYVYVILEEKDKFWEPIAVYKNRPIKTNLIYLKGNLTSRPLDKIWLKYGIESFFLSEESADEIESRMQRPNRDWQEIERQREEKMSKLDDEDRRIHKTGITEWWVKMLDKEVDYWIKERIIEQESATKIREKYTNALKRIKVAQEGEIETRPRHPLVVEVAVTKDGKGYPVKLFWEGKEYR